MQHRDGCGQVEPWHQRRHALHPARREGTSNDMDMEAYSMRCVSQGVSCKASGRGRGAPVQAVLGRTRRHGGGQPRRRSHGRSRNQGRSWGHGGRRREGVSGVDAWVADADVDGERHGSGGARRRLAHRLVRVRVRVSARVHGFVVSLRNGQIGSARQGSPRSLPTLLDRRRDGDDSLIR